MIVELLEEGDAALADAMPRLGLAQLPHVEPVALDDITRVEITPTRLGNRGQRYSVTYRGAMLVESTRTPAFAACRALLARGITGRLEVCRRGKTCTDMQLDIEAGAGLTIIETETESLRLAKWSPSPWNGVSRRGVTSAGGDLASVPTKH